MPETIPKSSPFDRWNHHPQMVDLFPTSLYGVLDFWLCTPGCRLLLLPPPPSHTTCSHTTCSHTTCSHTACSHTTTHTQLGSWRRRGCLCGRRGTRRHRRAFCVASVALTALGWLWWRAWALFGAVVAAAVCVAGVALGDIDVHSAWQAWHPQLFHPTCLAPSPFLPAFPSHFHICLVIIGRNWHVGLSGPLIVGLPTLFQLPNTLW